MKVAGASSSRRREQDAPPTLETVFFGSTKECGENSHGLAARATSNQSRVSGLIETEGVEGGGGVGGAGG